MVDAADADLAAARRVIEDFSLTPPNHPGAAAGGAAAAGVRGVRKRSHRDAGNYYVDDDASDDDGDDGGDEEEGASEMSEFHGFGTERPRRLEWVGVAMEDLAAAVAAAREALKPKDLYAVLGRVALTPGCQIGYEYMDTGCHQASF
jgi:hypothetical protein